ncbi:hypothetical protein IT408_00270 [Candidatus Uhrbacteria bacterium]|nr:hypothetical protein [Candidatus Uhrbacteria bacterium]
MTRPSFSQKKIVRRFGKPIPGAQIELPWGDILQDETIQGIEAGSIWHSDQALTMHTKGQTTHRLYTDVYSLLSSGLKIRDTYEMCHSAKSSGYKHPISDIEDARLVTHTVLALRDISEMDTGLNAAINLRLTSNDSKKSDENRTTACKRFVQSIHAFNQHLRIDIPIENERFSEQKSIRSIAKTDDDSGNRDHLRHLETMESNADWLEYRIAKIYVLIGRTIAIYKELWRVLTEPEFYLRSTKHRLELNTVLEAFISSARMIHFRPFRNNAHRAIRDAQMIQDALMFGYDKSTLEGLIRLRQRLHWILMLNSVQCEIVMPLGLISDHFTQIKNKYSKQTDSFDNAEYQRLRKALAELPRRLYSLSDQKMDVLVKENASKKFTQAISFFEQKKWASCLAALESVMDTLLTATLNKGKRSPTSYGVGFFVFRLFR